MSDSDFDRMSIDIGKLAKDLAKAQSEFEKISAGKTGQVGHRKYKYADLGSFLAEVKKILPKCRLAVVQRPLPSEGDVVRLETRLLHESGQWIGSELCIKVANATPQAIGSALTYARRYSLASMLGLATEEDDDGKAAGVTAGPPASHKPTTVDDGKQLNANVKQRIIKACQDLEWPPEKLKEVLTKRGVEKLDSLSDVDGTELASALEKKFLDEQGKQAFS